MQHEDQQYQEGSNNMNGGGYSELQVEEGFTL